MFKFFKNSKKEKRLRNIEEEIHNLSRVFQEMARYKDFSNLSEKVYLLENEVKSAQLFNPNSVNKRFSFEKKEIDFCGIDKEIYFINDVEVDLRTNYGDGEYLFCCKRDKSLGAISVKVFIIEGVEKGIVEVINWTSYEKLTYDEDWLSREKFKLEDDEDYWRGKFNY